MLGTNCQRHACHAIVRLAQVTKYGTGFSPEGSKHASHHFDDKWVCSSYQSRNNATCFCNLAQLHPTAEV